MGGDGIVIPVGLLIGLVFATHDHFKIDRKIEIVVLLIASVLSYLLPIGFVLSI
jgi:ABC-type dipeptide/oligopeptide/nickel transport system permease component